MWIFYVTRVGGAGLDRLDGPPRDAASSGRDTVSQPAGGRIGGGGVSRQWDDNVRVVRSLTELGGSNQTSSSSGRRRRSGDTDDGVVLLMVLLILAGVLSGAALYLVWQTQFPLAEATLAALLTAGLIRAARRDEASGWTRGVFRATFLPFLFVMLASALAGSAVQRACPTALRLSDLFARCP
jgi:hypothetical protein